MTTKKPSVVLISNRPDLLTWAKNIFLEMRDRYGNRRILDVTTFDCGELPKPRDRLIVLINGPQGCGKSTAGALFESYTGIHPDVDFIVNTTQTESSKYFRNHSGYKYMEQPAADVGGIESLLSSAPCFLYDETMARVNNISADGQQKIKEWLKDGGQHEQSPAPEPVVVSPGAPAAGAYRIKIGLGPRVPLPAHPGVDDIVNWWLRRLYITIEEEIPPPIVNIKMSTGLAGGGGGPYRNTGPLK